MKYVSPQSAADEARVQAALATYGSSRDPVLRDEIAARSAWLAIRGARRFADRGEPLDDLIQVAMIGLLKAIERYDTAHGVQFGAYATPTIMGELRRHFRDHTWSVKVPRRAKDLRGAVGDATEALSRTLGRSPRITEIAEYLTISEDAVLETLEAINAYRTSVLDPFGNGVAAIDDAGLDNVLDRQVIAGLLDRLRPRERRILHLRFFEELSQAQIAETIGTSQVHVGRLIASSLLELRAAIDSDRSPEIDDPPTG